jgi:hypothetical protein
MGFLKGRQILDVVGIAQECIHNIIVNNLKALILKMDMQKAYDYVKLDFLQMILLRTSFGLMLTNCIMSCVNTNLFAILINGEPTPLFQSG